MYTQQLNKIFWGLQFLAIFAVLIALISICSAQEYPNRAIDIVVAWAPGGGSDNFHRTIREALAKQLNVPVNIVNRPGAGGVVGTSFVANSKPDGYTLTAGEEFSFLIPQIITPKAVRYDVLKDFQPIAHCAYEPLLLAIRSDLECKTVEDLISYAKESPGKLIAGTSGVGTQNRIDLELFKSATGTNIRWVTFNSGGEILVNILGGHVDLTFTTLSASRSHIKAGKLRALAALSAERVPEFSEIPTTKEKGIPEVNLNMNYIILGPKGLSPKITDILSNAVKAALTSPELYPKLIRMGYIVEFLPPDQFEDRMKKNFNRYNELIRKSGLIQD